MAFGKGSGSSTFPQGTQVYYASIKVKDLPKPIIEVQKKEGDEYVLVSTDANMVSGDVIGVQNRERRDPKTNKVISRSVSVTLLDRKASPPEAIFLTIPHTYLGRNALNALIALETFNDITIQVYKGKPRQDPKNPSVMREGFDSVAVRQSGELIYGKYKNDELPAIPKVTVGDVTMGDTKAITEFFIKEVDSLAARIRAKTSVGKTVSHENSDDEDSPPADADDAPLGFGPPATEDGDAAPKKYPF